MMAVPSWVMTDDFRCPICFGSVEYQLAERESDEGIWEDIKLRCIECGHAWTSEP
jgi:DNA-directed RNA polymerase subunit M/transcription elongation factor TFIIS